MNASAKHRLTEVASVFGIIHSLGWFVSFIYFSYLYWREHGFLDWLLFGEIMPLLKSSVWEVFLILSLIQQEPSAQAELRNLTDVWWRSEYPSLIDIVNTSKDKSLTVSYRTGPKGDAQVNLQLSLDVKGGLTAYIKPPEEAFSSIRPNNVESSKMGPSLRIVVRDHDLDGIPDDFTSDPPSNPTPGEELTDDGFIVFKNTPAHRGILVMWSMSIGFCVNYFLHDLESVMPRTK